MLNYKSGNYAELRRYFSDIDWKEKLVGKDITKQYSVFCEQYKAGVLKFIPPQGEKKKRVKVWFNNECEKAKEKRDLLWNRYRRHSSEQAYRRYKQARNDYTRIRREAQKNFEKTLS
mgnify:CR=1 FL=1